MAKASFLDKLKTPKSIFALAAVIGALILSAHFIRGVPKDPSPLGNGLILVAMGVFLLTVSLIVKKLRKFDPSDIPLILGVILGGISVILGTLLMFGINFGLETKVLIGLLYAINAIVTASLVFTK